MTRNAKISVGLVIVAIVGVLVFARLSGQDDPAPSADGPNAPSDAATGGPSALLVRPDSQRLSTGTDATFVEFLDFECEACGALYPTIEDLRETYGDRVAFVVRYMPLHVSSVNAAKAAEAAAAQGKFEEMYDLLFQRQKEWGHQDDPEEQRFFDYADELGLDMERFRKDYDDPATLARIEQSQADGEALGVSGTPTMFMDGEMLQPESLEDLVAAFDAAVAD